ncbi:MAG: ArsR family transcriptional regulator [Promethearchaeota archaeon]|nr:MAG: ArsR family transcriptional regulator [Candidatus Lokiarchaeota archaeon]
MKENEPYLIENLLGSRARVKILKILAINSELNISSIIKEANLNHKNAKKHLQYLKKVDLIQQKNFGRIKIFRFKKENLKAKCFKNFLEIWEDL